MTELPAPGPLFRNDGYVRAWVVGLLSGVVRWLEMLALGIFAFDLTGSPGLVALLVMLRFLPLALLGGVFGVLSDIVSPLRVLRAGLAAMALVAGGLAVQFHFGAAAYWHLALAAFLSGAFWACDLPCRRKLIGDFVGPARLANAMALDGATNNGTRMAGPLAGGLIYQSAGIDGAFAIGAVFYLAALAVAATVRDEIASEPSATMAASPRPAAGRTGLGPWRDAAEALAFARARPDILRILLVTVVFNIWAFPYLALVPVLGRETFGLDAGVIGAFMALEG